MLYEKNMMPKLIFKFDKEDDLKNIWKTCNTESSYGYNWKNSVTDNIFKICHGKKYATCKKELEKTMRYIYKNPVINVIAESFNKSWNTIRKDYFSKLEKIMKESFCSKEVIVYLTASQRCPYNPNKKNSSFHVNFFGGIPNILVTSGHELMHIQFHNSKYWKICEKKLGNQKTHDLKEALTILLNLEFHDLLINEDRVYPNHIQLRKFIKEQWKKEKDFDVLIDESIKWIKENGIK